MKRRDASTLLLTMAGQSVSASAGGAESSVALHRVRRMPLEGPLVAVVPRHGLLPDGPQEPLVAALLAAAEARRTVPEPEFAAGTGLMALCLGPALDEPDQAQAGAQAAVDEGLRRITLAWHHTEVRATGRALRQNRRWHPLAAWPLPDALSEGRWQLQSVWHAVRELGDAATVLHPPRVAQAGFQLRRR